MKSSHSCRRCRRWLEGEWNQATSDGDRAELQRQMDNGICDVCPNPPAWTWFHSAARKAELGNSQTS